MLGLLGLCWYALHNNAVTIDAFCVALFMLRLLFAACGLLWFVAGHLFGWCESLHEAPRVACVATWYIITPSGSIVNLSCLCVCALCRFGVFPDRCVRIAGRVSCALELGEN